MGDQEETVKPKVRTLKVKRMFDKKEYALVDSYETEEEYSTARQVQIDAGLLTQTRPGKRNKVRYWKLYARELTKEEQKAKAKAEAKKAKAEE